jgi:hypothetical protein
MENKMPAKNLQPVAIYIDIPDNIKEDPIAVNAFLVQAVQEGNYVQIPEGRFAKPLVKGRPGDPDWPRKIVQISACSNGNSWELFALDDNGHVWRRFNQNWHRMENDKGLPKG